MKSPDSQPTTLPEHRAGRSFTDPSRPLGEGLIERADPRGGDPNEGVYGRATRAADIGHGVAERAKGVSVLRKAEELMASGNPDGGTEDGRRRALELACGRVGVTLDYFDRLVNQDPELQALLTNVMEAARTHSLKI
jgi:hypothetical protein